MNETLLFLTCPPRSVTSLVDELTTHLEAEQSAARVIKYGVLSKGQDGFIILAVPYPDGFPAPLLDVVQQEEEITGYVQVGRKSDFGSEEAHYDHD